MHGKFKHLTDAVQRNVTSAPGEMDMYMDTENDVPNWPILVFEYVTVNSSKIPSSLLG